MERWRALLRAGIERMDLRGDANTHSLALLATLHGGLLLTQTMQSLAPLEAALDSALVALRSHELAQRT
jgi:hypothetical protein